MTLKGDEPILVSTCLTGLPARYDGGETANRELLRLLEGWAWVPVCPEQMGGLPIPRPPNTILDLQGREAADGYDVLKGRARVVDSGGDRTGEFVRGGRAVSALAGILGAKIALLRKNSPSCGSVPGTGSDGSPRPIGVTAALLMDQGLKVLEVDGQGVGEAVRKLLSR